ncbi:MAG: LysM peptidoglycan-binding domain-containing protein [Candidatus Tectomicrobia bacterium]|uniref:LysM peptidoglycan-binding domain-containing protein n=1 Tax=Tectimicrobiota bacterium TaxID=2528274 RepID=A0A932GNB5_UNCTE|nr:LysM peptidoglycan-binding domain-containing protein [Candidatus Tectomicrobia bacterium]
MPGLPGRVLITGMMLWLAGCVTLDTQQELIDAKAALEAARSIGAEVYSPDRYRRAQEAIRQSERELTDGHQEMGRALANEARENAEAAEAETLVIKARAKETATRAIAEVRQQMERARQAVATWRDQGALEEDLRIATGLVAEAQSALVRAQNANDRGDAQSSLIEVSRVRQSLGQVEGALSRVQAVLQERERQRKLAEEAKKEVPAPAPEAGPVAEEVQASAPQAKPVEKEPAAPPPQTYTVKPGDSLWNIAARPEVYNNPWLWPLIFTANENALKDPDLLRPGQTLIIPRDYDEEKAREAERKARQRGGWSLKDNR